VRFVFLGTGTSSGVPAIGCDCPVCTSDDPRDSRLRTSAALHFTDPRGTPRTILFDAGPDLRTQALRAGMRRVDAILFTHNHVDHTFGLDEVRRFNAVMKAPIDVYADAHTLDFLRRVFAHIFNKQMNVNDSFVATLIAHQIEPLRPFTLHGLKVTPFPLLHGRLPILGYRIETDPTASSAPFPHESGWGIQTPITPLAPSSVPDGAPILPLAYCTDVSAIPPESWVHLRGLGTLVLDALRHRHHPTHLTLQQAVGIADRVGAGKTCFVHMSHDLAHKDTQASLPDGMFLAHDGLTLESPG
jgi:phosphoribosyl 1,2-cyclic phosphate phosphodiesterase